ncbi:MAG: zinc metallopeptidase [Gammaproteobacteria bacterium]
MIALLVIAVVAVIFGPQLWAGYVLRRYAAERPDLPGTGAELARHLIRAAGMDGYRVERADAGIGDHFDPATARVALSPGNYDGRSLTAAVVAAHEFGHAVQHRIRYRPLTLRTQLATFAAMAERFASLLLVAMPFVAVLTRMPAAGAGMLLAGVLVMALPVLVHLVTLPVELDASFNRALPILAGGYLEPADLPHARRILTACALTYVAGSLASLLNFWRWIRLLRR